MISSEALLVIGMFAATSVLGWGLSGVFTGKILTKAYGAVNGRRVYSRFVYRDQEPVWFWTLCGTYTSIGIMMMAVIYFYFHTLVMPG